MKPKKRKPVYKKSAPRQEFDIEQTLLKNRQLFLYDHVDDDSILKLCKQLYALDTVNHDPIMLYINSGGGSCSAGLALINTMKTIDSPVVTIINEEVCSMGGHISVAGDKRVCYEDSVFMAHDAATYIEDYFGKIEDRAEFLKKYKKLLDDNLRRHTNLSEAQLKRAKNGELWLFSEEMLEFGIVDEIIVHKDKK